MEKAFTNYSDAQLIYRGPHTDIYRGIRKLDSIPVVIKKLKSEYPTFEEISEIKNEYEMLKGINSPEVIQVYGLEWEQGVPLLIEEDFGGESVDKFLKNRLKVPLEIFFQIAIQIVSGLEIVHEHLIHKDIKPHNLIYNEKTGVAKIIDFGISTPMQREMQSVQAKQLEGSLAYISPEQTGRMNREIDYRTDFYSLGISFYEMLTGQLPFDVEDMLEMVHSHIAKQPMAPVEIDSTIPLFVSNIVMKLMAKAPEDRYKSAYGLKKDLEKCQSLFEQQKLDDIYELGTQDFYQRFQIPQKLYGRAHEVTTLLNAFEQSIKETELILISGFSGIGKSRLVGEIHRPILEKGGLFIAGKFEQFKSDVPYAGVIQAFEGYLQHLLTLNDEKIAIWKQKLLVTLGDEAQILIDALPSLGIILGNVPLAKKIDSKDQEQERFNRLFLKFVSIFAKPSSPMVIFLDDLQWVDGGTLKFIELLLKLKDIAGLLIIGAFRDNEVSNLHPLSIAIERIEKQTKKIEKIFLAPLSFVDVNIMVADAVNYPPEQTEPLSTIILKKTEGNPFFINQLLLYLYQEKIFTFNRTEGRWLWDIAEVKKVQATDNVIDLIVNKLNKCKPATQFILKLASLIGNVFSVNFLSLVADLSSNEIRIPLKEAILEGFIIPQGDSTRIFWDSIEKEMPSSSELIFQFQHDRIQQASSTLFTEEEKKNLHLKIARLLLKETPISEQSEKIFDCAYHLNLAIDLIKKAEEKLQVIEINLMAAQKALNWSAFGQTLKYTEVAIGLLPPDAWSTYYGLTSNLYISRLEAYYFMGNLVELTPLVELLLKQLKEPVKIVKVYLILLNKDTRKAIFTSVIPITKLCMELLKYPYPKKITFFHSLIALAKVNRILRKDIQNKLLSLPINKNPTHGLVTKIFSYSLFLYEISPVIYLYDIIQGLLLSLQFGYTKEYPLILNNFGAIVNAGFGNYKKGLIFSKTSLKLAETVEFALYFASVVNMSLYNSLLLYKRQAEYPDLILKAYAAGMSNQDFVQCDGLMYAFPGNAFWVAKNLIEFDVFVRKAIDHFATYRTDVSNPSTNLIKGIQQTSKALRGETYYPTAFDSDEFNEAEFDENRKIYYHDIVDYWISICRQMLVYVFNSYPDDYHPEISFLSPPRAVIFQYVQYFGKAIQCLQMFDFFEKVDRKTQKKYIQTMQAYLKFLKPKIEVFPENFIHLSLAIQGCLNHIYKKDELTIQNWEQAVLFAKQNEFMLFAAMIEELLAKLYLKKGRNLLAQNSMKEAVYSYYRLGAYAKVKDIQAKYKELLQSSHSYQKGHAVNFLRTTTLSTWHHQEVQFSTAFSVAQEITGTLFLPELIQRAETVIRLNLQVEKVQFIIKQDKKWSEVGEHPLSLPTEILHEIEGTQKFIIEDKNSTQIGIKNYLHINDIRTFIAFPLIYQKQILGIMVCINPLQDEDFSAIHIQFLEIIIPQLSTFFKNSFLYADVKKLSVELKESNLSLADYSHNLETKVEERTEELGQKNKRLHSTIEEVKTLKDQVLQREKLAELGQLTRHVALQLYSPIHEAFQYTESCLTKFKELEQHIVSKDTQMLKQIMEELKRNLVVISVKSQQSDKIVNDLITRANLLIK